MKKNHLGFLLPLILSLAPVPRPGMWLLSLLRSPRCPLPRTAWAAWTLPLCQDGTFPALPAQRSHLGAGRLEGGGVAESAFLEPYDAAAGLGRSRRGLAMRAPPGKSLQSLTADLHCEKFTSPAENSIFIGDNQM